MSVFTLINKTKRNLVIAGKRNKRKTLIPGIPVKIEGEFKDHPWVKRGWLTATEESVDTTDNNEVAAAPTEPLPSEVSTKETDAPSQSERGEELQAKRRDDNERSQRSQRSR